MLSYDAISLRALRLIQPMISSPMGMRTIGPVFIRDYFVRVPEIFIFFTQNPHSVRQQYACEMRLMELPEHSLSIQGTLD